MILNEEITDILNIARDEDIHVYFSVTAMSLNDGTLMSKYIEIRLDRLLSTPNTDQVKFKRISKEVYDRIKYLHPDASCRTWPDYNPNVEKDYTSIKYNLLT